MKETGSWRSMQQLGAIWLCLAYLLVAAVWFLYADRLAAAWINDADRLAQWHAYKNWLPVVATAGLLYLLCLHRLSPVAGADVTSFSEEQRVKRLIIAFTGLFVAAILANLAYAMFQARQNVLTEKSNTAQKMAQVLEEQTAGNIYAVEIALQATIRALDILSPRATERQQEMHKIMQGHIDKLPFVRAIWVLDRHGNMVHDSENLPSRYNFAEREYFQVHRNHPAYGLYIGKPKLSRHGVWFIDVSQRMNNADGSFAGVAVAAIEPQYLQRFYESIKVGQNGVVALMQIDGTLMLRVPPLDSVSGQKLTPLPPFVSMVQQQSAGSYQTVSSVDGIERLYFYRRVGERPLVVLVGLGKNEMLAGWLATVRAYVGASLAFLAVILALAYLALRELQRRTALNQALRASENALANAQQLAHIGSWHLDLATMTGHWSQEMYRLLGLAPMAAAPPLSKFLELIHPDDRYCIEQASQDGRPWDRVLRSNPALGPIRYFHAKGSQVRDADNRVTGIAGTLQDVTEQRAAEEKLRLAARVFDHTSDGIIVTDANSTIIAVNAAFERITGYSEAEVLGKNPRILHSDRHDANFYQTLWQTLVSTGQWRGEIWNRRKNGEMYPEWLIISMIRDEQNRCTGFVGVFADLSEIREANEQLDFLVNHDPLTRLPNRSLLNDRLQQAIDTARADDRQIALLLLNIDRLQRINDSIGHDAGDALLQETAQRLQAQLRPGDTLARLGSDEFVEAITQFDDAADIITSAKQMLEAVTAPCVIAGHELTVTASIGIAIYPQDGATPGDLLKNADAALSHAKNTGRNSFRFFTAEMNARALHWMSLEQRLRGALSRNELSLEYQPQVCLADDCICGVEALIRWNDAERGRVLPEEFIPLAEDTGLISTIGEWAIRTACAQNKAWQDRGLAPLRMAVNVSPVQITKGTLPAVVRSALQHTGLSPKCLEIEITESVLMRETELALRQIAELRAMGVTVSLDDFGTGYSSLGYLSRFSLDKLKIDRGFVRDITSNAKSAAIAHATIALAHGLGISVIAEGVETEEQLRYLRDAGCNEIQGFFISQPVAASGLVALLTRRQSLLDYSARAG